MQQTYYCSNCGAPVTYGEPYCGNCGMYFDWGAEQIPPQHNYQQPGQQAGDQQQQPYYQQPEQQAWDQQQQPYYQQPGWNQPPPYNQPPGPGMPGQHGGAIPQKKGPSSLIIFMSVIIVVLLAVAGVGIASKGTFFIPDKEGKTPPATEGLESTLPAVSTFTISPTSIASGEAATLAWATTGATTVSINQGIGEVSSSGTQDVSPASTTTYKITATNSDGTTTKSVTITVTKLPVINSFTAKPASIVSGNSTALKWDVSGATTVTINKNIGEVDLTGTKSVSPTTTTTYTLTAANNVGSVDKSVKVTVTANEAEIISFTADPLTIVAGESTTLKWEVENGSSASINQSIGTVDTDSGTETVHPTTTTTYKLTVEGNYGDTTTATVTVNVATAEPEIVSFDADPSTITETGTSTLTWEVEDATTVLIDHSVGYVDPSSGSKEVSVTTTTIYTITATNGLGTDTDTVTVTISVGGPIIIDFTADFDSTTKEVTLEWEVTGADLIKILNHNTNVELDFYNLKGTVSDYINVDTIYTLTASMTGYDDITEDITVTVE